MSAFPGPFEFAQTPAVPTLCDCWAIVEIFGHQQYAGWVSTIALGSAVMIHILVPELPERQELATYSGWALNPETGQRVATPAGSTIKLAPVPSFAKIFGPAAIFGITPCSEQACLKAAEQFAASRPWILVSLPTAAAISAGNLELSCSECGERIIERNPDHPGVCDSCFELSQQD